MCYRYILGEKGNPIKRYVKRVNKDNEQGVRVMSTRYCHERGWRNAVGPRGGKAIREFARYVWYADGAFYSMRRVCHKHEDGSATFSNILEPITGTIEDIHANQSRDTGIPVVNINCYMGIPVEIEVDGEWHEVDPDAWPNVESALYLDGRRLPRWTKGGQYAA